MGVVENFKPSRHTCTSHKDMESFLVENFPPPFDHLLVHVCLKVQGFKMVKFENNENENDNEKTDNVVEDADPYFVPIVSLPEVEVPTGEDQENEIFKMRAKLFRYDSCADPPEWKERGTGDVKLLQSKEKSGKIRILMRRDKTLKVCANHFLQPWMLLKQMKGSDRAWMWLVQADFADEEAKQETLAIRFANADNAKKFKDAFDNAVLKVTETEADRIEGKDEVAEKPKSKDDDPSEKMTQLTIKEETSK